MNTALLNAMIDRYNAFAYTHNYLYGFYYKNLVHMVRTTAETMPYILKIDKASRGGGYSLRFCPTADQKIFLMSLGGSTILCSKSFFEQTCKENRYNQGENFERMVFEYYHLPWTKNNTCFTKAGDIVIDDVAYQIKFERATFTNEKILARIAKSLQEKT